MTEDSNNREDSGANDATLGYPNPFSFIQGLISSLSVSATTTIPEESHEDEDDDESLDSHHDDTNNSNNIDHELDIYLRDLIGATYDAMLLQKCINRTNMGSSYTHLWQLHQQENWDCGIACLLTILFWIQQEQEDYKVLDSESLAVESTQRRADIIHAIGSQSVWTADLVYQLHPMLQESGLGRYLFCSKTFTVVNDYQDVGFYEASFGADLSRVNRLFSELQSPEMNANLHCMEQGIPLTTILNAVCHENCIAMVLCDNSILSEPKRSALGMTTSSYLGHYVVVCGISTDPTHIAECQSEVDEDDAAPTSDQPYCIVLCNPAKSQPPISFALPGHFDRARKAWGTDEDVLFLARRRHNTS